MIWAYLVKNEVCSLTKSSLKIGKHGLILEEISLLPRRKD